MFFAGMEGAFSFRIRAFVLAGLATTTTCHTQAGGVTVLGEHCQHQQPPSELGNSCASIRYR